MPQRSRCEPGAVPQLRCPSGTSQVACVTSTNDSPRRKGRSCGSPPEPTSSADKRRFFMKGLVFALFAALLLVPAATASPPQRIVSLSPTATEDLFAIGAGPQVVAVDDQSDYPANAPKSKLSGYTPNAEAIAGYRPDLVVISNDANGLVAALHRLHIPILLQPAAKNLPGAYAEIAQLGSATGHVAAAKRLIASMRSRIDGVVGSLPKA